MTHRPPDFKKLVSLSTETLSSIVLWEFFLSWRNSPWWAKASSLSRIHDHTRHITLGRSPLDGWSTRWETSTWQHTIFARDRHPSPQAVFEPIISASERT